MGRIVGLAIGLAWIAYAGVAAELSGISLPCADVSLAFTVSGRVERLNVREGQAVRAGDVLAELDARILDARIAQLEFEANADTAIRAAAAEAKQRAADAEKIRAAHAKGAASSLELEHARLEANIALFRREIAENERELARLKLAETRAEREQLRLPCPLAGRVEKIAVKVGEAAKALEPAVRVVAVDPLWIEAPMPLALLRSLDLKEGVTAQARFPDGGEAEGAVIFVAFAADAASETAKIRVAVPNPAQRRAGERVRLAFAADDSASVVSNGSVAEEKAQTQP